jgi:ribosomal protein S18 acetylase RimI-like enzyme
MEPITIVEGAARHHEFITEAQILMAFETEKLKLDPETVKLGVGAVLVDSSKGKYYVAKNHSGEPIACMLTLSEWSDWRNKNAIWIHSLYVKPEYRGKGVYKQMFEHLKFMVRSSDQLYALKLYVDKRNQAARDVYSKLGMTSDHYETYEWVKS